MPAVGVSSPLTARSRVVLPAPLVPSDRDRFAGRDLEVEPEEHLHPAVPGVEPPDAHPR